MAKADLSEFEALSKPRRKPCATGRALAELEKPEAAQLQAALDEPKDVITAGAIAAWLDSRSHQTTPQSVGAHRRGECGCAHE